MGIALAIHALGAVLLVGSSFVALVLLRPGAPSPDSAVILTLWRDVVGRLLLRAWIGIVALLASGHAIVHLAFGSLVAAGAYVRVMLGLGLLLAVVFAYLQLVPWQRFRRAVMASEWVLAERNISRVRTLLAIAVAVGSVTVAIGSGGRYFS